LENELTARDTQLNDLKASAAGNEELKKQFEALQAENQKRIEEHNAKIKELSISAAVKIALASDVHDPDLVSSLIDKSKVEIDDAGSIKAGLEDQIKSLREAKGFLFVDKQAKLPGFKGVGPRDSEGKPIEGGKNPWAKEHYNLTEQGKLLRENPELAKQMMSAAK
jgi:hypothetical protein